MKVMVSSSLVPCSTDGDTKLISSVHHHMTILVNCQNFLTTALYLPHIKQKNQPMPGGVGRTQYEQWRHQERWKKKQGLKIFLNASSVNKSVIDQIQESAVYR